AHELADLTNLLYIPDLRRNLPSPHALLVQRRKAALRIVLRLERALRVAVVTGVKARFIHEARGVQHLETIQVEALLIEQARRPVLTLAIGRGSLVHATIAPQIKVQGVLAERIKGRCSRR